MQKNGLKKQRAFISYIVLIVITLVVLASGIYIAAKNSIPGDPLYQVEVKIEELEGFFNH